jgi:8-oxo-dGTP diphosphatase
MQKDIANPNLEERYTVLAKNKSGWTLLEYLKVKEEEINNYDNVTGAFAIMNVHGLYLIGFNNWRKQWEFPAGGIEKGETAREAAERELFEETHQRNTDLHFKGLFRVMKPNGEIRFQTIFLCYQDKLELFIKTEDDEMSKIMLWDLKQDIGYVDECDLKMVELSCL